ncbi:hypothetical protein [Corynebacterium flavescens]|nr:hypothetical protein [Corynebacterium flavescens]
MADAHAQIACMTEFSERGRCEGLGVVAAASAEKAMVASVASTG